ncbi:hypothetical protein ACHAPT_012529 [Fusarium lateritium]
MTTDSSVFIRFPDLPPELRSQIWHQALPVIGPAICRYREGLWHPRYLQPGDEEYSAEWEDNICLDFRPDLFIKVPVEIPLIFVNREARSVAQGWARKHGVEIQPESQTCVRPFDLESDIIYVNIDQFEDCYMEPHERMLEPDLVGRMISLTIRPQNLAVSEMAFRTDTVKPIILSLHNYAYHLYVIVGEQPDVEGLWELDRSRGRSVFWNPEQQRFHMGEGELITDEDLYRTIEEDKKGLSPDLEDFVRLEVRPAFAVRK